MYSQKIRKILLSKKIKTGDRVLVESGGEKYEGMLMPSTDFSDPDNVIIKLDSGYNIGVRAASVSRLKTGKPVEFRHASIHNGKSSKPPVSILGCGGTIASRVEYSTGAVFPSFSPADLVASFPEINDVARISGRKLFDLLSEDMNPSHWQVIAKEAAKEIGSGASGVVLMHGTDTMHYTSAALSFMLQGLPVPVILVGAQRSSDRGSSDNAMNLISAVLSAASSDIAEVMVCMHANMDDDYCILHQGTKVRKLHTSRRDAFRSINVPPFAKVNYEQKSIEYLRKDYRRREKRKLLLDTKVNPNVALVHSHPGMNPKFIESLGKNYDGVVIAGTGLGHVPTNPFRDKLAVSIIPALEGLIKSGVPVVMAPQTIYGRLNLNVYTAGRMLNEIGVIGDGCDWTPECALAKLMFVLGHTKDMKKVSEMMLTNISGEVSERSRVGTFLV